MGVEVSLVYAVESIAALLAAKDLQEAHWLEVGQAMPHKLATQRYLAMQNCGGLATITARCDGALVGYAVFFVQGHWHYADYLIAQNDLIFLMPEHRAGRNVTRLLDFAEDHLRAKGATKVYYHVKRSNDWGNLLEARGAAAEEAIYGRLL